VDADVAVDFIMDALCDVDRENSIILGRKWKTDSSKRIGIDSIRAYAFHLSILEAQQWEADERRVPGCRRKSFRVTSTWKDFIVKFETCATER